MTVFMPTSSRLLSLEDTLLGAWFHQHSSFKALCDALRKWHSEEASDSTSTARPSHVLWLEGSRCCRPEACSRCNQGCQHSDRFGDLPSLGLQARVPCNCGEDCPPINMFLASTAQNTTFSGGKGRRKHVRHQLDGSRATGDVRLTGAD